MSSNRLDVNCKLLIYNKLFKIMPMNKFEFPNCCRKEQRTFVNICQKRSELKPSFVQVQFLRIFSNYWLRKVGKKFFMR